MSLKRRFFRRIINAPEARELLMNTLAVGERDSAKDLDRIADHILEPALARSVMRHFGEENKHAVLFRRRHEALGFTLKDSPPDLDYERIVQRFRMGTTKERIDDPRPFDTHDLIVFFCGAKAGEERACKEMAGLLDGLADDAETVAVLREIHADEIRHVSYATEFLETVAEEGHRAEVVRALRRARRAEARANRILGIAFVKRLLSILGLGPVFGFFVRMSLEFEFLARFAFPGGLDRPILRNAMAVPVATLQRPVTGAGASGRAA